MKYSRSWASQAEVITDLREIAAYVAWQTYEHEASCACNECELLYHASEMLNKLTKGEASAEKNPHETQPE